MSTSEKTILKSMFYDDRELSTSDYYHILYRTVLDNNINMLCALSSSYLSA